MTATTAAAAILANRPSSLPAPRRQASTPRWLGINGVVIAVLAVIAAVLSSVAVSARQSAVSTSRSTTAPALVDAQTMYLSLSDADSTAAASFLVGPVPTAFLLSRYQNDLAQASASLVAVVRQGGGGVTVTASLRTVAVDTPVYAGLVQTAQANNRLGLPVGAAYLSEASNLMRRAILPAADRVYQGERDRLGSAASSATSWTLSAIAGVVLVVLLLCLVVFQRRLSVRFRRTLNIPLLAATVVVLVVPLWMVIDLRAQNGDVHRSTTQGSDLLDRYTQARIEALQAKADDELTLVTRDSVSAYQTDYGHLAAQLSTTLRAAAGGSAPHDQKAASEAWVAYQGVHRTIRSTDNSGDLTTAVSRASGSLPTDLPSVSARLDGALQTAITNAERSFDRSASHASADTQALAAGALALCLLAALLGSLGVRQRRAEYR